VIGKWFGDFLCPEFVEGFRQRFPVFKAQGHIHSEFGMLCKDGQRIVMSFEGKIGYSADGEFKQTHCMLRDITDQRMAERALIVSEERFRVAQEISPDGFTILHPVRSETGEIIDFAWVYENQAIANINQTDPQKVIGKRVLELFPGHSGTIIFEAYKHVANTGETQILEEINVGEVISKPAWLRLVVVSMGEDIAILAQDITERKAAEKTSEENVFRFQSLFNEMSAGAAIYKVLNDGQHGKDYIIQDFNRAALKAEGKEKTEVLGKSLYDLRPKIDEYGLIPIFQSVWKTGEPAYCPSKIYVDEKFSNWYENRVYKLPSGEIVAIFEDVTEKSLAAESLKKQNDLFASLLKILPVGVFMVDSAEGRPLVVNETGKALLGSGILPDANEHNFSEVYKAYKGDTEKHYPTGEMPITLGMKGVKSHIDDMTVERPDGSRILLEVFGTPVNDPKGKPWASLVAFMDITDRKKAENELLYLSFHDHLTGLYNRRYFEQELKKMDTPENLPLSIIMFDVNGLKLVNDSFGHDLGDVLLKKSAEAIIKACREEDIAARIGGDEFVVLLPKTAASEALQVSNYIKELASNEKVANLELSISYGYDTKKTDKQSINEIIANAENHMYRHKLYERSSIRSKMTDLIMNTLFEKSDREAAHSNRVSSICEAIASKMNMGQEAVKKMKIAGLIHDIGKIGVDERILNKPGSLTFEERGYIERHPEIGWRLLSSTDEFSELAKYVLSHHENWDGTGYPNGIKGEAIPLEARIISVADAYDAMTSVRSYRDKLSKEEAVNELRRCSGTQFDPEIVDVFLNQVLSEENFR
ncbi:MAG: diguanylate cyclase, partial [Synergistaceae bacterium]|nr:diguanylate cyclase [Synergistaceae bacterium]